MSLLSTCFLVAALNICSFVSLCYNHNLKQNNMRKNYKHKNSDYISHQHICHMLIDHISCLQDTKHHILTLFLDVPTLEVIFDTYFSEYFSLLRSHFSILIHRFGIQSLCNIKATLWWCLNTYRLVLFFYLLSTG